MRLFVYFNFITFYVYLTKALDYTNFYLPVIKTVRSYYSASSTVFLYPVIDYIDEMKIMYTLHAWSYILEHEQITTVSLPLTDIAKLTRYYTNVSRPLIVHFLTGQLQFDDFSSKTKLVKMSNFAWLVICMSLTFTSLDACNVPKGNPFHLSFDTQMLVMNHNENVLREWYSLDGETTEIHSLFKWHNTTKESSQSALELLSNLTLYERRNDLKGKVLRGVIVKQSVLVTYEKNKLKGYFNTAVKALETALNFSLDISATEWEYGSFNSTTKRWSGALRLVASNMVDIGVSDFSMTNTRLDYVDYLAPIITTTSCLFLKRPDMISVRWFAYLQAFSNIVWESIFACFLVSVCTLIFLRSRIASSGMMRCEFYEEIFRMLGVMCQQALVEINVHQTSIVLGLSFVTKVAVFKVVVTFEYPRQSALRIAYCTMFMTAFVMSSAYSAALIGFLTASVRDIPFRTIDEFIDDGTYKIIVLKGSSDFDMFFDPNDPWSLKVKPMLKPIEAQPLDMTSGFQSVCNSPKVAFYFSYSKRFQQVMIKFRIPCRVTCLRVGRTTSLSLILPKDSQYTDVLNYHLKKLLNSGLMNRFMRYEPDEERNDFEPVGFNSVASVLFIFACGVALSFLLLSIEICYSKYKRRYFR